jgi:hypothetical protein
MKCPACENDIPSGRSACTLCGAQLPSAGERPGPEPRFPSGPAMNPQTGPPNPKTEPLPIPVWDVGEERPWNTPSERFGSPQAGAMPPEPGPATQNFDAPAAHPRPPEYDPATQNLGAPMTGPIPPFGHDPAGWNQGVPPVAGQTAADGRTGKSRKMPLLAAAIAVVAVLVGGLVYALTRGLPGSEQNTHTAGGKPDAAQQAAAANQVLKSGRTARGHLPSRMRTCDDVAAGVPGFRQVVRDRQQELSQSKGLKVDGLRDGPRLRRSMIAAYQSSLDADQAYLAWTQEVQAKNCGGRTAPLTAHYRDAISANGKAGPAKRQVVTLWKPIASSHRLPTYAWNHL